MKKVNTELLTLKLSDHLNDEHNKNIFFSGKYGVGKTTFLKSFFEANEKYFPVFLSPVNYAVSSNEDVFELIKVDIIKQLFLKGKLKIKEDVKIGAFEVLKEYAKSHPIKLTSRIASLLSKLHPVAEVITSASKSVYSLITEIEDFEKTLNNKETDSDSKLLDHLSDFTNAKGTYIEYDIISQLLYSSIGKIEQTTVLVIDDMDRLDPEHIFRIMNILSAHHSDDFNEHKFGFDKVMLIADIENIEKLYHYKYGPEVDFDGYIDKFYSKEVFVFNNDESLHEFIFNEIQIDLPEEHLLALSYLLAYFVKKQQLKLRNIIKYHRIQKAKSFEIHRASFKELSFHSLNAMPHIASQVQVYISSSSLAELEILRFLINVFGSSKLLSKGLNLMLADSAPITSQEKLTFATSFVLLNKLVHSEKNPFLPFCKEIDGEFRNKKFIYHSSDFSYPAANLLGMNFTIVPVYTGRNKYNGQNCFYHGAERVMENDNNQIISYSLIASLLKESLDFIIKKGFNTNLMIASI